MPPIVTKNREVADAAAGPDETWIALSNGIECVVVPDASVSKMMDQGFYRPADRGMTVLAKDGRLFEVPLDLGRLAESQGYRNLLQRERNAMRTPKSISEMAPVATSAVDATQPERVAPLGATDEPVVVLDGSTMADVLARAAAEDEAARQSRLQAIDGCTGWRQSLVRLRFWLQDQRRDWTRQIGTSGISVLIHVAILLLLASVWLVNETPAGRVILASADMETELTEEFIVETEPLEITEPDVPEPEAAAPSEELAPSVTDMVPVPDFMASVTALEVQTPAPPSADNGKSEKGKAKAKPTLFGSKFTARTFVFVIDNSNSMTRGRFETALIELMRTVDQLSPKQRFYVAFYSDTAYGMLHPNVVANLVPATVQNKEYLRRWLGTVELCLKTNGRKAIESAMALRPDVIYVLGDGSFTDGAAKHFARNPNPSVILHTRGMEVKESAAVDFRQLATVHRGTYRDVGVSPEGAALAKQYPRRRNNQRGPVWGITLPVAKK